jgi:type II secretory pathway component PulF
MAPGAKAGIESVVQTVERAPRRTYGDGFVDIIRCAQRHPALCEHLPQLASLRAGLRAHRSEMVGAVMGPAVTLLAAVGACAVTAHIVLPRFDLWLSELSLPTPAGFAASRTAMQLVFGVIGIAGALGLAALVAWLVRRGALARLLFSSSSIAAPVRAAMSRTLAIATACELPQDEALELAAAVISHRHASRVLRASRRAADAGTPLWQLLGRVDLVPANLLTGVRAANNTTLPGALDALASYFAVEADARRSTVRAVVGTAITVAAAVMCLWLSLTIATGYAALLG